MKVRFTGGGEYGQRVRQGAADLRIGEIYAVLEIYCQTEGANYFRIEYRRDELPALFDSRLFEMVDSEMHPSWTTSLRSDGSLMVAPTAWHAAGFWEEFTSHSPEAIKIYENARGVILRDFE